jgi:hypothetical protein
VLRGLGLYIHGRQDVVCSVVETRCCAFYSSAELLGDKTGCPVPRAAGTPGPVRAGAGDMLLKKEKADEKIEGLFTSACLIV